MSLKIESTRSAAHLVGDGSVYYENEEVILIEIELTGKAWKIVGCSEGAIDLLNEDKEPKYTTIKYFGYEGYILWSCDISEERLLLTLVKDTGGY